VRRLSGLVRYRDEHKGRTGDLASITAFYRNLASPRLVILGEPGSGKTVLAIELVLSLIRHCEGSGQAEDPVPLRVSLGSWHGDQDLEGWLTERLIMDHGVLPVTARDLVERRRILPILDGLDEMDPDFSAEDRREPRRAQTTVSKLNAYLQGDRAPAVVVTCRARRYIQLKQQGGGLRDAQHVNILPLTSAQIREYVEDRFSEDMVRLSAWQVVLNRLDDPDATGLRAALSTPWRLFLATTATADGRSPGRILPGFVDAHSAAVLNRIDHQLLAEYVPAAIRLAAQRQRRHRYSARRVAVWLHHLARHLDWQAVYADRAAAPPGLSGSDLVLHLLWPIAGWRRVRVFHTILGLAAVPGQLTLALLLLVDPPTAWIQGIHDLKPGITDQAFVPPMLVLMIAFGVLALTIRSATLPWPPVRTEVRRKVRFRESLLGGLSIGLLTGGAVGISEDIAFGIVFGVAVALLSVAYLFSRTIRGGEVKTISPWNPDVTVTSPRALLRNLLKRALSDIIFAGFYPGISTEIATVIAVSTIVGGDLGEIASIPIAVVCTFVGAIAFGLILGGNGAWVRYALALTLMAVTGKLPWRLGRFLDWAADAEILRVSGVAYQFRHLELQRWLADQPRR
jgi:hypothetical protein